MGAAGDMLAAALLELHPDPKGFISRLNSLGIPNVTVTAEKVKKCGIEGTHINVEVKNGHHHCHSHTGIKDIENIISALDISGTVKENAAAVYRLIAQAEGYVHGTEMENIHFHEVGTMDAVTDVMSVCMLLEELAPDRVICSPVNVGGGTVKCAHGTLPVPAPAAAYLLRGVPVYGGDIKSELCTPTGAALIRHFATDFSSLPAMRISSIGYGMGTKDFDTANCVRAFMGDTQDTSDEVCELRCNVDDMTGEEMGFACEMLMENGALDVFTAHVGMKKGRPGILLTCLCRKDEQKKFAELIFKYTSTIGIRKYSISRYTLSRRSVTLRTDYGSVSAKESTGFGTRKVKAEYDDIAEIARKNGISLRDINSR